MDAKGSGIIVRATSLGESPGYLRILNHIFNGLRERSKFQHLRESRRGDVFVRESGGPGRLRSKILEAINPEFLAMLKSDRLDLESLLQVKKYDYPTDGSCPWEVYLHVICNQNGTAGIYVGQSQLLERRIRDHTRERSQFQRRTEAERNIGHHEKLPSSHIAFWVLRGVNDIWLKFAQLPRQPANELEEDRQQLLLTILEEYAALIFRTLPPSELALGLPPDCEVQPYPWAGLNICDPLDQLINDPRSYAKSSKKRKLGRFGLQLYEEFWRHVDIVKGDSETIPIVCGGCRDASTGRLDEEPLF
ncbi:hypothetical protein CSIM01_01312 [Colletotrichum simmondsii]|uniref:GIY-YIG domain-containing protein n=1 Tax=Colletotrichum simmondsii TaxID=703756 RepID=A0A135TAJ8_9PEZI|nr:hypothetical protein CSIM01_01312 [Colletotrichum simmondsii]